MPWIRCSWCHDRFWTGTRLRQHEWSVHEDFVTYAAPGGLRCRADRHPLTGQFYCMTCERSIQCASKLRDHHHAASCAGAAFWYLPRESSTQESTQASTPESALEFTFTMDTKIHMSTNEPVEGLNSTSDSSDSAQSEVSPPEAESTLPALVLITPPYTPVSTTEQVESLDTTSDSSDSVSTTEPVKSLDCQRILGH